MSLSSDSLSLCHKCTATEHALNNADPLVVKKKARQAAMTAAKPNSALKKSSLAISVSPTLLHLLK